MQHVDTHQHNQCLEQTHDVNIDWDAIKERKQKAIHKSNERKNLLRINHTYSAAGD